MERVVVERLFEQPITFEQYDRIRRDGQWCFDQYRVEYHATYLSADGRQTACIFDAPDAEALRNVSRTLGVAEGLAWRAVFRIPDTVFSSHNGTACSARAGFETIVVQRQFDAPISIADIEAIPEPADLSLEAHRVRCLCSYVARHGLRMLCVYEAPDVEAVRLAETNRNMPFERVWRATLHP